MVVLFLILQNLSLLYCQESEFSLNLPKDTWKCVVLIQAELLLNGTTVYQPIGTGFWFGTDKCNYVITAQHVLKKYNQQKQTFEEYLFNKIRFLYYTVGKNEETSAIISIDLKIANDVRAIYASDKKDIIAVKIGRALGNGLWETPKCIILEKKGEGIIPVVKNKDCLKFEKVELTSDIIFFGFPSSLKRFSEIFSLQEIQFDPELPMFRKGIIAGKNKNKKTLILDGEVHEGNSGGPVFLIEQDTPGHKKIWLIGLTTQFIPYVSVSINEKGLPTNINLQNAGYSVVEPIDYVIELIEKYEKEQIKK